MPNAQGPKELTSEDFGRSMVYGLKTNLEKVESMKRKLAVFLGVMIVIGSVVSGCSPATTEYTLGQSFVLKPGESAAILNEDLNLTFKEVINDSRCPTGAVCIWQGQVQCLLNITIEGKKEQLTLTQSGLSGMAFQTYHQYYLEFNVTPYPNLEEDIKAYDYRIELKVSLIG
ncbi:MAG: hypothetical protein ACRKGH_06095 [Dehalogenimonas sp.]